MYSYDDVLELLKYYIGVGERLERDRLDMLNSTMPAWLKDQRDVEMRRQIEDNRKVLASALEELTRFPPYHGRHAPLLETFHQGGLYNQSVFIMTKFPDPQSQDAGDVRLREVIGAVQAAVARCQHTPRIASENNYHNSLWDNVELHLLGCSRGVAIVEDKHSQELNPNVAMEWGWMVGMGRRVLYLVEKDFQHSRADWGGLIKEPFDWGGDLKDIAQAVHKFLGCALQH